MGVRLALFQRIMLIVVEGRGSSVLSWGIFIAKGVTGLFKTKNQNKTPVCWFSCSEIFGWLELNLRKNITKLFFIKGFLALYIFSLSPCFSHLAFSFGTLATLNKSGGIIFLTVSQTTSQLWDIQFPEGCWNDFKSCLRVRPPLSKARKKKKKAHHSFEAHASVCFHSLFRYDSHCAFWRLD